MVFVKYLWSATANICMLDLLLNSAEVFLSCCINVLRWMPNQPLS